MKKRFPNDVCLSNVPKGEKPLAYLFFNKEGYSVYCKDYQQYWDWVSSARCPLCPDRSTRPGLRCRTYDALLSACWKWLRKLPDGTIRVRRSNREELLTIRSGVPLPLKTRKPGPKRKWSRTALYLIRVPCPSLIPLPLKRYWLKCGGMVYRMK
ncbi:MAG: hypothetical protein R3B47_16595 [Bacteroidia bacterium]